MKASEQRHTNGVTSFNRVVGRQCVSFPPRKGVKLAAPDAQTVGGRKEEWPKTRGARFQQLATNERRERVRDARPRARGSSCPVASSTLRVSPKSKCHGQGSKLLPSRAFARGDQGALRGIGEKKGKHSRRDRERETDTVSGSTSFNLGSRRKVAPGSAQRVFTFQYREDAASV